MSAANPAMAEHDELLALFARSKGAFLRALDGVSEMDARVKPDADSWSILEVAEHIAVAEHGMFRLLEMAGEKLTAPDFEQDAKIRMAAPDRRHKRQAPERSLPTGRWKTLREAADAFCAARGKTVEMVRNAGDLRRKLVQHPAFDEVDGFQLCTIMGLHVERHVMQIEEIKQRRQTKIN